MFMGAFRGSMGAIMYDVSDAYVDLFMGAFRSSMGAIMYVVSDAYVEWTLSRRLIVAVFMYWRRVHGVVD